MEENIDNLKEEEILKIYNDLVESGEDFLACKPGFWYGAIICK